MNRYIVKAFFNTKNGVDFDVIPIFEKNKETIIEKLNLNSKSLFNDTFDLYNYTWTSSDYIEHGVVILTIDEFFGGFDVNGW